MVLVTESDDQKSKMQKSPEPAPAKKMKKTRSKSPVKKPASAKKRVTKNPTSNDVAKESPTRAPEIDLE